MRYAISSIPACAAGCKAVADGPPWISRTWPTRPDVQPPLRAVCASDVRAVGRSTSCSSGGSETVSLRPPQRAPAGHNGREKRARGARSMRGGRCMAALDGMRVLDMTQYEAGTSCTQVLAWLGAEVVKVEPPRGDPGRQTAPGSNSVSQYFLNYNSNKQSVVLDLAKPEGRELLLRLVPRFDVFVENYGPGVIEQLNIGYEVMRPLNPGLIYGRIKGFGLSGPYSGYKSYDWVAQAAAATFSVTGTPDGPPMRPAPTIGDSGTGIQMALAITAAYVQKQRTGEGQFIEISMQEAVTMFMRT